MKGYKVHVTSDIASIAQIRGTESHVIQVPGVVIQEVLGSGANGIAFKGVDALGRDVAVKVYPPRADRRKNSDALRQQALSEAQKLGSLKHDRLPAIYSFGVVASNWPYVVMEFLPGRSLRDEMPRLRADFDRRAQLLLDVFDALKYAESRQLLHGDLHAGNVMISGAETYVIDFGTSQLAGRDRSAIRHARLLKQFTYDVLPELKSWFQPTIKLNRLVGFDMLPTLVDAVGLFLELRSQALDAPARQSHDWYDYVHYKRIGPHELGRRIALMGAFDMGMLLDRISEGPYDRDDMQTIKEAIVGFESCRPNDPLFIDDGELSIRLMSQGGVPDGRWFPAQGAVCREPLRKHNDCSLKNELVCHQAHEAAVMRRPLIGMCGRPGTGIPSSWRTRSTRSACLNWRTPGAWRPTRRVQRVAQLGR